jgi:RHS repeat-associated protein
MSMSSGFSQAKSSPRPAGRGRIVTVILALLLLAPDAALAGQSAREAHNAFAACAREAVSLGYATATLLTLLGSAVAAAAPKEPAASKGESRPAAKRPPAGRDRVNGFVVGGEDGERRAVRAAALLQAPGGSLPPEERDSVYTPQNQVGNPPGATTPGATSPPAAMSGTEAPGSSNFTFSLPVIDLPGRGVDASLSLVYNSRIWNVSKTAGNLKRMTFCVGGTTPAPGFTLGFGKLSLQANEVYLLVDPDGTRHRLLFSSASGNYVSTDGTFIKYNEPTTTLTYSDGARIIYTPLTLSASGQYPAKIIDSNGNFIEVFYRNGGPQIDHINDTLGRQITFQYDATTGVLVTVEAPGYDGSATPRQTVRLYYETISIKPAGSFASNVLTSDVTSARVIRYVYFPGTQSGYRYDYSQPYGMIYRVAQLRGMQVSTASNSQTGTVTSDGQQAALTTYNYPLTPSNLTDAPTFTRRTDDWAGRTTSMTENGQEVAPFYTFAVNQTAGISTVTAPDGTSTETGTIVHPGFWDDGLVKYVEVRSGSAVLRRTERDWETWGIPNALYNQRVKTVRMNDETGQTVTTDYVYWDGATGFNNIKKVIQKGFAGEELRVTKYAYETGSDYETQGLLRLTTSVAAYGNSADADAGSNAASLVEYAYDGSGLSSCPGITMVDPAYSSVTARGNVTSVTSYADAAAKTGAVTNTATYDVAGNILTQTVSCCLLKRFEYGAGDNYANLTSVKRGDAGQLTSGIAYDHNTGLPRSMTDENGQVTTFDYDAASLRSTKTTQPDGGYTRVEYHDTLVDDQTEPDAVLRHSYIKTTTAIDQTGGTFREVSDWQYADGRGALARSFAQTPEGYVTSDVEYDLMGRAYRSNNPYIVASPDAAAVSQTTWTVREFDALSRMKKVTTPDNNFVQVDYAGRVTMVTDQAGKKRRQLSNALGQVERVDEPDASGSLDGGSINSPAQATTYEYDTLGNLTKSVQGVQQRTYKYNSLGQLIRQKQPEAAAVFDDAGNYVPGSHAGALWSSVFAYDTHGNMLDAYDARNVHTHYDYTDGLNRLKEVTFSDGTPKVRYTYDEQHTNFFNAGYATKVETLSADGTVQAAQSFDYDLMGRVAGHQQKVGTNTYSTAYAFNLLGQLTREQYPSGRAVEQTYDAAARLATTKDAAAGGRTYASGMAYGAHGGLTSVSLGNGTAESYAYDDKRLDLKEVKLTKGAQPADIIEDLVYKYGVVDPDTGTVDASKNNGQISVTENSVGGSLQWQQRFTYDSLGRLKQASEHPGNGLSNTSYKMAYDYDRYGNRKMAANQSQALAYTPVVDADIDAQTNRFTNGVTYDDAGNVTDDNKFTLMRYAYDANGRQRSVSTPAGALVSSAVYDALGQRVQTTSGGETRDYVYDAFGRVVAEYSTQAPTGAGGVNYITVDVQGSTRVVTDAAGAPVVRRDYEPYGAEVGAGVGQRTSAQKYGAAEGTRQRYGGMERDGALDHAAWRKYDRASGRWTSPDPYTGSMRAGDPQSFNRYAYVGGDPVNFVDPSGLADDFVNDVQDGDDHPIRTNSSTHSWQDDLPSLHLPDLFLPVVSQRRRRRVTPPPQRPGASLTDVVARSKQLLMKPACRNLFGKGSNPSGDIDRMRAQGRISAGASYAINFGINPRTGNAIPGSLGMKRFADDALMKEAGAVTLDLNVRQTYPATNPHIYFNAPGGVMLDSLDGAALGLIHEMLHVKGRIPMDDPNKLKDNFAQSKLNNKIVNMFCADHPVSTPETPIVTTLMGGGP